MAEGPRIEAELQSAGQEFIDSSGGNLDEVQRLIYEARDLGLGVAEIAHVSGLPDATVAELISD